MTSPAPHFLADVMLKKAGRWLRILGFNCKFPENEDDDAIMEQAAREKLVLLTKDEELAARAQRAGVRVFKTTKIHNPKQVAEIMRAFGLKMPSRLAPLRCAACNGELRKAKKSEMKEKVHPNVLKRYRSFWLCTECGHAFWKGSHWEKIEEEAKEIRKEISKLK